MDALGRPFHARAGCAALHVVYKEPRSLRGKSILDALPAILCLFLPALINFAQKKPMPLGYRALLDGLHTAPIYEIEIPEMAEDGVCPDVQINDLKFLGSYDWTEAESPTIVVPGTLSPSSDLTPD